LGEIFHDLTRQKSLELAWLKVKRKADVSPSPQTRREANDFASEGHSSIVSLQQRLIRGSFRFSPQKGVRMKRPNRNFRPLVLAPNENRIVSRAVLDILQDVEAVSEIENSSTSFGGNRSTAEAIRKITTEIRSGKTWVLRSDIPENST
jgi:retron-type reverse transcriptase